MCLVSVVAALPLLLNGVSLCAPGSFLFVLCLLASGTAADAPLVDCVSCALLPLGALLAGVLISIAAGSDPVERLLGSSLLLAEVLVSSILGELKWSAVGVPLDGEIVAARFE